MVAKHLLSGISILLFTAPAAGANLPPQLNPNLINSNHDLVETGFQAAPVVSGTEARLAFSEQVQLIAQARIEQGEVYDVQGTATRIRSGSATRATEDPRTDLIPRDEVTTAANAQADLLFEDDSIVRLGQSTSFVFPEGLREYELNNGTIVTMIRPGRGGGTVTTPQATVVARGTVFYVQQCADSRTALIAVATNNPSGVDPTRVYNERGDRVSLRAGQLVQVIDGEIQPVQTFSLREFYDSNALSNGLGNDAEDEAALAAAPTDVQDVLNDVREETIAALNGQPSDLDFDYPDGVPDVCANVPPQPVRGLW